MSEETRGRDATINAVAAAIAAAQNVPFPGPRQRKIAERLAEAGWLKDPADRAEIERLSEQVTAFANEIVQMHQDRDAYDTALEAQLDEARNGLDERDRIIIERDNEIVQLRADRVLTPTDSDGDALDLILACVGDNDERQLIRYVIQGEGLHVGFAARRAAVGVSVPADPKEQP